MKVLLDTSVLVAASVAEHPDHARCLRWLGLARAGEIELVLASHSLVECYSVLTRLPIQPRISPAEAQRLLAENVLPHAKVVALSAHETVRHLADSAGQEIGGGAIYDSLIVRTAEKAEVDRIVTLNLTHFLRVASKGRERITAP